MIRRPPRSTPLYSSAASDVYKRQLCKKLKIATPDARIAVSAATASGIGAIFRAPLRGALLGAELLYRDDMESDAIMPSLLSSIVAFVVFGSVYGFEPIFGSLS